MDIWNRIWNALTALKLGNATDRCAKVWNTGDWWLIGGEGSSMVSGVQGKEHGQSLQKGLCNIEAGQKGRRQSFRRPWKISNSSSV